MSTGTPSETASWLRAIADRLDQAPSAPLTVHLTLHVSQYTTTLSEADRMSAVDGFASVFNTTAQPTKVGSYWE
jgi:hypothetical protein